MISEAQKAKIRQKRYAAAAAITVLAPLLATALAEGGVSKWVALVVGALGFLSGAGGLGVAAAKTRVQRENGVFDEPEPVSAVEQVINGLNVIVDAAQSAVADRDTITQAAASVLGVGVNAVVDGASAVDQAIAAARKA